MIYLILCCASKAYSNHLRTLDDLNKDGLKRQNTWLNKDGFFQDLGLQYERLQVKWTMFWAGVFSESLIPPV